MKKLLSITVALTMLLGSGVTAFAQTDDEVSVSPSPTIDMDVVTSNLSYSVLEAEKYDKLEIGEYMTAYVWNGNDLVSSAEEVLFYPIYGDDEIVAILTMFNPNGDQSYSISTDFANELNAATESGSQDYFIVEAGSKLFIHTGNQTALLRDYGEPMEAVAFQAEAVNTVSSGGPQPDGQPVVEDALSTNYEASNSLTVDGLGSYISINADSLPDTTNSYRESEENRIDIIYNNHQQTRTMHYLDTEILDQGNTEYCTFYAATIIGNYLTGWDDSPFDVMDWAGITFGNIFDAQSVINDYYGEDYSYIYDIYGRAANEFITRGYPMYAAFYNAEVTLGHAMAVTGYSDAGDYGIGVVETLGGYRKAIFPSSTSTYITRAYSQNCYWTATLFYQYW